MLLMCCDLIRLYTLRQSGPTFKSAIEVFAIFHPFFFALSFPGDAQKISVNQTIQGCRAGFCESRNFYRRLLKSRQIVRRQ